MKVPTVHLNGTSKDRLLQQLIDVAGACNMLLKALAEAAPNGRDYYPQGPKAINEALAEHKRRMQAVRTLHAEITNLAIAVSDQE